MCGIAGFVFRKGKTYQPPVAAILDQLRHRGPDDLGYVVYSEGNTKVGRDWTGPGGDPEVIFLHRRLSILDLSEAGSQPMGTRDGRYFITFNGEIYNYVELRLELEQRGYVFESHSDTEVLLAAYVTWGSEALCKLVGMFAFAILDTVQRTVFLARDFFGIKPLYYAFAANSLVFGSELKTLLEVGAVSRQVNANRLFSYLRRGLSDFGAETLLADVLQLPPAHCLEIALDRNWESRPVCYWQPTARQRRDDISFEQAAEQLRALFLKSVAFHLRSDVPIGAALSGGIDSSSVVMAMRHLEQHIDLHAFSYVADEKELNEEKWVDIIGHAARAQVHKVRSTAAELVADFDQLNYVQDVPSASTSLYAQYSVFRTAQQAGIRVVLDGQGADEMLGGYTYFRGARLASLVRQKRWQEAADFVCSACRWPGSSVSALLQDTADHLIPVLAQAPLRKLVGRDFVPSWLNLSWFHRKGVVPHRNRQGYSSTYVLREKLERELAEHLPSLLRYEDRNSMAFSIESRVPFLTPELVNFVLSLPEPYIIAHDGTSKAVFRRAMRGIVPDSILDRRDKIGFATPERTWLSAASPWIQEQFDTDVAAEIPAFHLDVLSRNWQEMKRGRSPFSFAVWRCLSVIAWTKRFQIQYA
jgi:asparagine synthase (glutamine-hydrolysing)